jgi:hypothetical protein
MFWFDAENHLFPNLTMFASTAYQARVIHNSNAEWQRIREAAEKARVSACTIGDELGEVTCSDLLEALELSRCLFLLKYSQKLVSIILC